MNKHLSLVLLLVLVASCKGRDKGHQAQKGLELPMSARASDDPPPPEEEEDHRSRDDGNDESGGTGTAMALEEGKMGKKDSDRAEGQYKMKKSMDDAKAEPAAVADGFGFAGDGPGGGGTGASNLTTGSYGTIGKGSGYGVGGGKNGNRAAGPAGASVETATRAWFPETFLFEPLVVTDANGAATVPVRVPDRLTTWHVLALAHSREGAQGGAVTSFLGTLPTYVDLVVPKFLVVGDEVKLPVQMVNTTDVTATSPLDLEVKNATLSGGGGTKTIPAQGGAVDFATLKAAKAGTIEIKATLGTTDAVIRTIEVRPSGRPETISKTGTLAAPRTFKITGPEGSDPATDRARLLVYPGALSLLRSELGVSTFRESVADDAYALLLAGQATELLQKLGDKADPEAIRTLSILTGQRAIRDGRTLDVDKATLLTAAALAHPGNPVLARLGERAVSYLVQNQRPDGSFAGGAGWTLQRTLVATAEAARAVGAAHITASERQRAMGVAARAQSYFGRNLEQATDPYTAAAILASGGGTPATVEKLRDRVKAAIKDADDGSKYLELPEKIVRADGSVPTRAEATALAVLALQGDPKAPLADLGGTLLGTYSPDRGWGDGRSNLVCMQAVLALFKDPVPAGVKITLLMDGKPVTEGTLDREALKEVLALEAPVPDGIAGEHEWKIVAEPAVPGLGYALALRGYVPWKKETTQQGLEMTMTPSPVTAEVGKPVEITVAAIAPSNVEVKLTQSLPAGVQPDTATLDALVTEGTLTKFEAADGKLTLFIPPMQPGQTFTAKYKVIATLAGKLRSAASMIEAGGTKFHVQPSEWTVK
ncbi:MAG: hypothetical protein IPQ07_13835 [Myxococcales bacterium]|nr:hypothetical protein [Myxococcales bacterium]